MMTYQRPTNLLIREPTYHEHDYSYPPPVYQTTARQSSTTARPVAYHTDSGTESLTSQDSQDFFEVRSSASDEAQNLPAEEQAFLDQNLAPISKPLPSPQEYPQLPRVIGIPQIGIGSIRKPPLPFERAYAPCLADYGISKTDFVRVIDTLNIALSQAAPFQVMQGASLVIGFVPHHWAMGVSASLGVLAGAGTAVTIRFHVKKFLQEVNRQVWVPRGLMMAMLKGQEVLDVLSVSEEHAWQTMDKNPARSLVKRRFEALTPYTAPLDWDVPTQEAPKNFLDKMSAKQQDRKANKEEIKQEKRLDKAERRQAKREKKATKRGFGPPERRPLEQDDDSSADSSDSDRSSILDYSGKIEKYKQKKLDVLTRTQEKLLSATKDKKRREIEKKRDEKLRDLEKEIQKEEKDLSEKQWKFERGSSKREAKRGSRIDKKNEKEREKIKKLRWIIIRPLTEADRAAFAAKANSS